MYTPFIAAHDRRATEAQYLFAAYVFDALGYRCYEWGCDDLNAASKRLVSHSPAAEARG